MVGERLKQVPGQRPQLVMIPGWGMHAGAWGSFASALSAHFRVRSLELPGHGNSAADAHWTPESLAEVGLKRFPGAHWLGWSLGGQVALAAARMASEQVRSLVLLCSNPQFTASATWPEAMDPADFRAFQGLFERDPAAAHAHFLGLVTAGSPSPRAALRQLRSALGSRLPDSGSLARGLDLLAATPEDSALTGLEKDVLWIGSGRDALVPLGAMRAASTLTKRGKFLACDEAGHAPFMTQAGALAGAIHQFTGETER